jgi:DNA-binding response OmpR family regulator
VVLVADDDPSVLALAVGILRGRGLECHPAKDGKQALELARTVLPELLILDIHMPFLNGLDVVAALREDPSTSSMKILMFTGDDDPAVVKLSTRLGANSYLCKPFRPLDFLRRVRGLLPAMSAEMPAFAVRRDDLTEPRSRYLESR